MPRRDFGSFISDAIEAYEAIFETAQGVDVDRYRSDLKTRATIEHQFIIIGEALNRAESIDPELRKRIPALPRIVSFRNRIVHGSFLVEPETVLAIIRQHLPKLLRDLREIAADLPPD